MRSANLQPNGLDEHNAATGDLLVRLPPIECQGGDDNGYRQHLAVKLLALLSLLALPQPGIATFYADDFHGRLTASGQVYDMYALTAANNVLPFGTRVEIVNPGNGQSVIVEVTDRGAFRHEFDLSLGAFSKLAHPDKGVIKVLWRVLQEMPTSRGEERVREVEAVHGCVCIPVGERV